MKALLIFSNGFHLFFILSTFNTVSLKVFKKICRKKATSEEYGEGGRRFLFRRDGEGTKRNNNFKSVPIYHNISHNILFDSEGGLFDSEGSKS